MKKNISKDDYYILPPKTVVFHLTESTKDLKFGDIIESDGLIISITTMSGAPIVGTIIDEKKFYNKLNNSLFETLGHKCIYYMTQIDIQYDYITHEYQLTDIVGIKEIKVIVKASDALLPLSPAKVIFIDGWEKFEVLIRKEDLKPNIGDFLYLTEKVYYVKSIKDYDNSEYEPSYLVVVEQYIKKESINVNISGTTAANSGTSGSCGSSGTSGQSGISGSSGRAGTCGVNCECQNCVSSSQVLDSGTSGTSGSGGSRCYVPSDSLFSIQSGSTSTSPMLNFTNSGSLNIGKINEFPTSVKEGDLIRLGDNEEFPDGYYVYDGYSWCPLVTWEKTTEGIKKSKKSKVYFSLDEDLNNKFDEYCEENAIGKSKLIENYIRDYMEKVFKQNDKKEKITIKDYIFIKDLELAYGCNIDRTDFKTWVLEMLNRKDRMGVLYGELNNNTNLMYVSLSNVSHVIRDIEYVILGDYIDALAITFEILSTQKGKILKSIIDNKMPYKLKLRLKGYTEDRVGDSKSYLKITSWSTIDIETK